MDPLSVLRDYTIKGELDKIQAAGEDFHFGDEYKFPRSIETAYRSKQGGFYNLECLVFFVKNSHLKHIDYLQHARVQKIQTVTLPDRKALLDYLQGKLSTTDAIDLVAPAGHHISEKQGDLVEEYRPEDPSLGLYENGNSKRIRLDSGAEDMDLGEGDPELGQTNDMSVLMELIRSRERPLKDRQTLLECPGRNFLSIVTSAQKREEEAKREQRELDRGTTPAKTPFRKDSISGLVGSHTPAKSVLGPQRPHGTPRPGTGYASQVSAKVKAEGPPIILVPSAFQTLLNMYNAKEFLEDGVYVFPDSKVNQMTKPESVIIKRKLSKDVAVPYEVRDKPSSLSSKDWDRVAAIFVLGKEWQFKGFPYKSHVEIFNHYIGFYLRFEDDGLESVKTVRQWNVKFLTISKHKRHQDKAAALEFWEKVDNFLLSQKRCPAF
eukprot:TRINITY_DN25733_c0_g1_i1.p1 TRINITY_DN25733_c0_g1~~TRINITY_DN25733_c0_g1_i1.p1  ORF type:complete len:435 (-),score=51.96 TRINITY_DN25733_c0_g1_i1:118-1422(-)